MRTHRTYPLRTVMLLIGGLLACSARDLSSLHNGVRESSAGAAGRATGGNAGTAGPAFGGTAGSAFGGTADSGFAGTAGSVIDYGPWGFDSEEEALNGQWLARTGKTLLGWISEGESLPLGSLVVDGHTARKWEIVHVLDPTPTAAAAGRPVDMSGYTLMVVARAASDTAHLQLFCVESLTFRRTNGPIVPVGTEWTTLRFRFDTPDPANLANDVTRTTSLAVTSTGPSVVWIDRAWLEWAAPGDANTADAGL